MSDSCANVGFLIAPLPLFYYFLFVVDTWNEKEKFLLPFAERFFFLNPFEPPEQEKKRMKYAQVELLSWLGILFLSG